MKAVKLDPKGRLRAAAVPRARQRSPFSRMFENQVASLVTRCDLTAVAGPMRTAWGSVGAIIARVVADGERGRDRLAGLRRDRHRQVRHAADLTGAHLTLWKNSPGPDPQRAGRAGLDPAHHRRLHRAYLLKNGPPRCAGSPSTPSCCVTPGCPQPAESVQLVRSEDILTVPGNSDRYVPDWATPWWYHTTGCATVVRTPSALGSRRSRTPEVRWVRRTCDGCENSPRGSGGERPPRVAPDETENPVLKRSILGDGYGRSVVPMLDLPLPPARRH